MDILKPAIQRVEAANVTYNSEILAGGAAPMIVKRANELRWIIIGTRGMTAIANLVMGSVATKVVHLARVPVTFVK
jgi:nucleotide-binding universal stress UspA family protein